jgi:hypothetical protein
VDLEGCWGWTGMVNESGYGMVRTDGRTKRRAHRVIWERYKGKIPPGMILHHKCQNRRCCNPDHLQMVTRAEHQALHMRPTNNRCGKGHEFTPENTYIRTGGTRVCRQCANERIKEWKAGAGREAERIRKTRYRARLKIQKVLAAFGDPGWSFPESLAAVPPA